MKCSDKCCEGDLQYRNCPDGVKRFAAHIVADILSAQSRIEGS